MNDNRPPGVVAIVVLCFIAGVTSLVFAVLIGSGRVPLSWGAFLLGGGLEQLGFLAFLLYAALLFLLALALWRRMRFARQATLLVAIIGIGMAVPAISSAVTDSRVFAIAREGLQIIIRVMIVFYLSQEPVKDWFAHRSID
jgi:hypothetical protein